jgi:hypothetical protein
MTIANIISDGVEKERNISQDKPVNISKIMEIVPAVKRKIRSKVDIFMIYLVLI